jgi:Na+/H+ antiporter NhaC
MQNMFDSQARRFIGITPILVFVVLVIVSGALTQDFSTMPILVALFISAGYALLLNNKKQTLSMSEKIDIFCRGGGEKTIILLVIIFLLAGAFYALTIDIGARDATVNWALQYVPTSFLLPGLFVIACFISFAMGTSMGTITAITPVGIGLAEPLGVSVPLAVGIVIGGAMFGDNLSFISDTTIAATRTQGVKLKDKFKANFIIVAPAALLTVLILFFVEIDTAAALSQSNYNLWLVLPYLLIIACALFGFNVIAVLGMGIISAATIGLITGSFDIPTMLHSIQKGLGWMQDLAMVALVIGGIVALMQAYGGMDWLMYQLTRHIRSVKGAEMSIAGLVSFLDLSTANNTIAIVSAGPIAKDLAAQYQLDPRRTASLLDIFSCGFQGLVPYGGQLLAAAAISGLSPWQISAYCWYPMLILLFGLAAIALNVPRFSVLQHDEFS